MTFDNKQPPVFNGCQQKVLFVTRPLSPPWDEASKNFAYYLALNLAPLNQNIELNILTKDFLPDLPKNIIQHPIYTSSENDFTFSQKLRSLFWQLRHKNEFDIIHYFFTPSKTNSWIIRNFLLPKEGQTIQTVATLREEINADQEIKKMIFADVAVAYSSHTAKKLRNLGFFNTQHIYPGIDLDIYRPRPKKQELLKFFNFQPDDFIITFTGEYVRLGGLDNLLRSFRKLIEKIPNIKLLLALRLKNPLDIDKKKKIKKKLQAANILHKVGFTDELENATAPSNSFMADLYNLSDLVLFTVRNMQGKFDIPLVIPEAMACGRPVIISDIPILREFANEKNAIIVPPDDIEKLTQTITFLYQHPAYRQKIAERGLIYSRKNFNIKNAAQRYYQLYQEILCCQTNNSFYTRKK